MRIILTESELKEALITWGVEKGVSLPDDIKVKVCRKSNDDGVGSVVIDVPNL